MIHARHVWNAIVRGAGIAESAGANAHAVALAARRTVVPVGIAITRAANANAAPNVGVRTKKIAMIAASANAVDARAVNRASAQTARIAMIAIPRDASASADLMDCMSTITARSLPIL